MSWKSPYVLLVFATIIWGGNFVVGKELVNDIPPITISFIRWSIALVVLAALYGRSLWEQREKYKAHWRIVLFLSLTGVAGFNTFVYIAVQYTDSINASLMNSATPMMIVVLSIIFLRERSSWIRGAGILISLIGVIWIISHGSWTTLIALTFNRGDLMMLLAVLCWAVYSIGVRKTSGKFPANEMLLLTVIITVIVLLPLSLIELALPHRPIHLLLPTVSGLFYIGLFASLIAFTFWNKAVALIGPSRCANFLNLIPFFSAIFATLFTGQHIHLYHFIGGCLILGGVYLTSRNLTVRQALKNEV